jgi:hypothetical protein
MRLAGGHVVPKGILRRHELSGRTGEPAGADQDTDRRPQQTSTPSTTTLPSAQQLQPAPTGRELAAHPHAGLLTAAAAPGSSAPHATLGQSPPPALIPQTVHAVNPGGGPLGSPPRSAHRAQHHAHASAPPRKLNPDDLTHGGATAGRRRHTTRTTGYRAANELDSQYVGRLGSRPTSATIGTVDDGSPR